MIAPPIWQKATPPMIHAEPSGAYQPAIAAPMAAPVLRTPAARAKTWLCASAGVRRSRLLNNAISKGPYGIPETKNTVSPPGRPVVSGAASRGTPTAKSRTTTRNSVKRSARVQQRTEQRADGEDGHQGTTGRQRTVLVCQQGRSDRQRPDTRLTHSGRQRHRSQAPLAPQQTGPLNHHFEDGTGQRLVDSSPLRTYGELEGEHARAHRHHSQRSGGRW